MVYYRFPHKDEHPGGTLPRMRHVHLLPKFGTERERDRIEVQVVQLGVELAGSRVKDLGGNHGAVP